MPPAVLDCEFIGDLFRQIDEVSHHLVEHQKTGMLMVLVPAEKILTYTGGGIAFEVDLPAYYVAVHPVTNAQYAHFLAETGHPLPNAREVRFRAKADHPVVGVNWEDATAYCLWAGLRLPTELEWEKAACGLDGRTFPWGRAWDSNRCRHYRNKGDETTANGWRYGQGGSPFGALQLSGNVWEWCAKDHNEGWNLAVPTSGEYRTVRGGSWDNGRPPDSKYAAWMRGEAWHNIPKDSLSSYDHNFSARSSNRRNSNDRDNSCGFRCVNGVGGSS
jgi:formylglycine-generating enzyme required for sulfatase activity